VNKQIKILLAVFLVCLFGILANLSWIQIFGAESLQGNAYNKRRMVEEYAVRRGDILSSDGQVLARSIETDTQYRYQREYPLGALFADITGYDSWRYGRSGLEASYNDELLGKGPQLTVRTLGNMLLGSSKRGNTLVLTVDSRLQRAAAEALDGNKGAVVALDPKTGAVLAMVTSPTYDPNVAVPLPGRDTQTAWDALNADPDRPLFDRPTNGLYPPGSSFKVVVAAAALDLGVSTPRSEFQCDGALPVEGYTIYDYGRRSHGELTFSKALVVSCNITFAQVGLRLGPRSFVQYAERFGFDKPVPFDLPTAASTVQDPDTMDDVALASASFGQGRDLATPLQMALVAAAVANGGSIMKPYLVNELQDYNGKIIEQTSPERLAKVMDEGTAETLAGMMVDAVDDGTGQAAQISGIAVAGKTGTAEVEGAEPHSWFICFAPERDPDIALAVVVENGGEGGRTAAPIARDILETALGIE
jgi:peptidoglycan glycosyltransferase